MNQQAPRDESYFWAGRPPELRSDDELLDGWNNESTERISEDDLYCHFDAFAALHPDWVEIASEARRLMELLLDFDDPIEESSPIDNLLHAIVTGAWRAALCAVANRLGVHSQELELFADIDSDHDPNEKSLVPEPDVRAACETFAAYLRSEFALHRDETDRLVERIRKEREA